MRGPLPVYIADPLNRLRFVSQAMDGLKESKQALGAEVIAGAQNFAPPTILAQASRLNFSTRLFNLIVTNVPGPQFPLYVLGREMLEAIPVAFLPENHALAIAIMSYNGQMNFGLLGDFDALPDIDAIGENIRRNSPGWSRWRARPPPPGLEPAWTPRPRGGHGPRIWRRSRRRCGSLSPTTPSWRWAFPDHADQRPLWHLYVSSALKHEWVWTCRRLRGRHGLRSHPGSRSSRPRRKHRCPR